MNVLVLDNGGYNIKVGYADQQPKSVINAISRSSDRRIYVGNALEDCKDFTGVQFRRPIERGHLFSWEAEKIIWDSIFDTKFLGNPVDPSETTLLLTEAPYSLAQLSVNTDQIVFEEYGFQRYRRAPAQSYVPWNDTAYLFGDTSSPRKSVAGPADCALVIDIGFNATNIVPVIRGKTQFPAIVRVDVAGKILTNFLKETISFRYYNMMEETYIINLIKEKTSFVSLDFMKDLEAWKKDKHPYQLSYLLPDHTNRFGSVLKDVSQAKKIQKEGEQQVLTLSNERFSVPEALFDPRELDIDQAGIPEAVLQAVLACPPETQSLLWANVVLTGGSALFPSLQERLEVEIRKLAPQSDTSRVRLPQDPINYAWSGGAAMGKSPQLASWTVSKQEYEETGESACLRMFGKNPGV